MGRIVELCAEIAEAAEEGEDGLVLPPEMWDRLREDWNDEDIDDALGLVRDSMLLGELAESADSLSARLVDILGGYADEASFRKVEAGEATISLDVVGQLARRVARLEDILAAYRDDAGPDHTNFDALQERLAVHGLEDMFDIPGLTKAGHGHGHEDENENEDERGDERGRQHRPPGAAPYGDDDDPER